jgi:hypothetical protein
MLHLIKLYVVPACVAVAFLVAVRALLHLAVPDARSLGLIVALIAGAIAGLLAAKRMREHEAAGFKAWH